MKNTVEVLRLDPDKVWFDIEPMNMQRDWMHKSYKKFAYKCLPLGIANQYGWQVLSPTDFSVSWFGGTKISDVDIEVEDPEFTKFFNSHFGESTLTLNLDFIIKTPENYSIYIRGIPNKTYGIIKPLDAIVETDWLPFTFTYNFLFMEPGTVSFKKGEPLFCFFPIERSTVENFEIVSKRIEDYPDFFQDFKEFSESRNSHLKGGYDDGTFQKFYINGEGPNKKYSIKNHLRKVFFGIIK